VRQSIARHQQLAREYRQSGDLASAAIQWQLVTLLAPGDGSAKQELAATRAEITRRVQENLGAGSAALKAGDYDRASEAMLKVMALDPENAEAAKDLREIERRRAAKVQAARAAKVNGESVAYNGRAQPSRASAPATPAPEAVDSELPLEMFKAGDTEGGLRDMRRYVDANPSDKAARNKLGTAVFDRARELEAQGSREQAYALYEQAVALRGEPGIGWNLRIQTLRKSLSDDYYEKGVQASKASVVSAMKDWEIALRYDPQNGKAAARLKDAKAVQDRLDKPPPKN